MKLLITGCNRSGTTLLAAMLGRHPEINMLNEDYFDGVDRLIGKEISAMKAPIPNILLHRKNKMLVVVLKRKLTWILRKLHIPFRIYGWYEKSISDFDRVIFIYRDKDANIQSILNRTHRTRRGARKDVELSRKIQNELFGLPYVKFVELYELTRRPESVMRKLCGWLGIEYDPRMLTGYKYTDVYKNDGIIKKI